MDKSNVTVITFTLTQSIFGFLANVLLIVLNSIEIHILRRKANKHFYEKILLSLTTCDLVNGILGLISLITITAINSRYHTTLCWNIGLYGAFYSQTTSILHLIVISLDRLWAVKAPLHHKIHVSGKKVIIAVSLSWGIPMILLLVNVAVNISQKMTFEEIYSYLANTMYSIFAKVVLLADIVFLSCYGDMIWIMTRPDKVLRYLELHHFCFFLFCFE